MRNTAQNKTGSERISHESDKLLSVGLSNMPLRMGLNLELMDTLPLYLCMAGLDVAEVSQPYSCALEWMEEREADITFGEIGVFCTKISRM